MTDFTMYRYNFCWEVRTLRIRNEEGGWQPRTPAMVAGMADHVWSLEEWLSFPAFQSSSDTIVVVHAANIQDRDGAKLLFAKATRLGPWLRMEHLWADGA